MRRKSGDENLETDGTFPIILPTSLESVPVKISGNWMARYAFGIYDGNRTDLRVSTRRTVLFVSECVHRINPRCVAGRNIAGEKCDAHEERRDENGCQHRDSLRTETRPIEVWQRAIRLSRWRLQSRKAASPAARLTRAPVSVVLLAPFEDQARGCVRGRSTKSLRRFRLPQEPARSRRKAPAPDRQTAME